MVDLPRRFVPTSSRFVSPVRIVVQSGHEAGITAVAFSPCTRFFASADSSGCVKIWAMETADILGSYLLEFVCTSLEWDGLDAIVCRDGQHERRIELSSDEELPEDIRLAMMKPDVSRVIRLIGAPEAVISDTGISITYNEKTWTHEIEGITRMSMDPCERYVVGMSPQRFIIANTYEESLFIDLPCDNYPEKSWMDFHISHRGDVCSLVSSDGSVWLINPMKKSASCMFMGLVKATVCDFGGDTLVLYGDDRGVLTVYDISQRMLLLRTPRKAKEFVAIYPSPENLGFLALRPESATAFLGYSQEILSAAPLPGVCLASCPGRTFSEVYTACGDNAIYKLCLDSNSIAKCCVFDGDDPVTNIAAGENLLILRLNSGKYLVHQNEKFSELKVKTKQVPQCMAISANDEKFALLFNDLIEFGDVANKSETQIVEVQGIRQFAFGKEKTANQIILFKEDLSVYTLNIMDCSIKDLQPLPLEHARIVSVAPAVKSFLYVLLKTEHGQLLIMKVGLNTGKASLVLRVFVHGTQIWAASTGEETVNMRNDASCLRIISGLKAYLIEDWVRSEPLSIF